VELLFFFLTERELSEKKEEEKSPTTILNNDGDWRTTARKPRSEGGEAFCPGGRRSRARERQRENEELRIFFPSKFFWREGVQEKDDTRCVLFLRYQCCYSLNKG
jgi:hypothetical protein